MTTNQTIDGVPRMQISDIADRIEHNYPNTAKELRALLDAPAVEVRDKCGVQMVDCPECSHQWDHFFECGNKPATQPQGEPVALLSKGFTTLETGDGKYRIITQYKNRDDAWSDYTALCKAEQPRPVAVVMSFDFEHPSSKERRTVALSKQDVFDGMEDYFYDKIGEQICRCESVGETNVVDCSCDEYVHDFEIVKASLTS